MELISTQQFNRLSPEQQHSHYIHRVTNILNTIDVRLSRKDFLGAYSNLHNCSEHIVKHFKLDVSKVKAVEGNNNNVIEYLKQKQYIEAFAVIKYLKQQLKEEGYKYQL